MTDRVRKGGDQNQRPEPTDSAEELQTEVDEWSPLTQSGSVPIPTLSLAWSSSLQSLHLSEQLQIERILRLHAEQIPRRF